LSDRFCCISMYGVAFNHESKTEDLLFFVFQSISRANTANAVKMDATPLVTTRICQLLT
jgi:hypothetical protein